MKRMYLSYFLDVSTPFYGGEGTFKVSSSRSMKDGDVCNASVWSFPNHAGTHIDFPLHFVNNGKSVHDYLPDFFSFKHVALLDVTNIGLGAFISPDLLDIHPAPESSELLLLKTGFGVYRGTDLYWQQSPVFQPELASYLRRRYPALRAVGFDTISVSSWTDRTRGREAHRAFLGGDPPILLIEDMNLGDIEPDMFFEGVTVAPLLVKNADASPCTVIAEVIE